MCRTRWNKIIKKSRIYGVITFLLIAIFFSMYHTKEINDGFKIGAGVLTFFSLGVFLYYEGKESREDKIK